ncbi:hypothetical protein, partial [Flavobacterium hercynium]
MEKPKNIKISSFKNLKNPNISVEISLFNELKNIKTGIFQDQILNCRKAYNQGEKDIYIKLKSQLPSVTFSGVFKNGRKIQNLEIYN